MRYCARCKQWVNTMNPGGFPAHLCQTPEDGHTFRIEAHSRGSYGVVGQEGHTDAEWMGEPPFTIEVRAWSLRDALAKAAQLPLPLWRLTPEEPAVPPEVRVETMARAMWSALPATPCGWDGAPEEDRAVWRRLAAAAIAADPAAIYACLPIARVEVVEDEYGISVRRLP